MAMQAALLADRGVLRLSGPDTRKFLHDLVTSDIAGLAPGEARFAALLQPQGKILFDFFVVSPDETTYLLDAPSAVIADLAKRLGFYKLRAKVEVADLSASHAVAAAWGGPVEAARLTVFTDPRLDALGHRLLGERAAIDAWLAAREDAGADAYHAHRLAHSMPEGGRDFAFGEVFPHEADMDQVGGVDFAKGCFIGQEVVSRMQHRGTARKRFVPVEADGALPAPGTEIRAGDMLLGTLGTAHGGRGLALLRLDRVDEALQAGLPIRAGDTALRVLKPDWARFAFPGEKAGAA